MYSTQLQCTSMLRIRFIAMSMVTEEQPLLAVCCELLVGTAQTLM